MYLAFSIELSIMESEHFSFRPRFKLQTGYNELYLQYLIASVHFDCIPTLLNSHKRPGRLLIRTYDFQVSYLVEKASTISSSQAKPASVSFTL